MDVFVPTYNEDISVLEATLVGCNNMRMDHTTYLLDDGRRPEVKELARRMGCGYLTREDNKHAKAGNINAALKKTDGDLIVVLDADMVPQPDFLEKTTGYFRKKKNCYSTAAAGILQSGLDAASKPGFELARAAAFLPCDTAR